MLFLPTIPGNPYLRSAYWMPGEKACFVETQVRRMRCIPVCLGNPTPHAAETKEEAKSELMAADPRRKSEAGFENWLPCFGVSNLLSYPQCRRAQKTKPFPLYQQPVIGA